MLGDGEARVRRRAALAVGRVGLAEGVPPLVRGCSRIRTPRCGRWRAFALGLLGDRRPSTPLVAALDDTDAARAGTRGRGARPVGDARDRPAPSAQMAAAHVAAGALRGLAPDDLPYPMPPETEALRLALYALARLKSWDGIARVVLDGAGSRCRTGGRSPTRCSGSTTRARRRRCWRCRRNGQVRARVRGARPRRDQGPRGGAGVLLPLARRRGATAARSAIEAMRALGGMKARDAGAGAAPACAAMPASTPRCARRRSSRSASIGARGTPRRCSICCRTAVGRPCAAPRSGHSRRSISDALHRRRCRDSIPIPTGRCARTIAGRWDAARARVAALPGCQLLARDAIARRRGGVAGARRGEGVGRRALLRRAPRARRRRACGRPRPALGEMKRPRRRGRRSQARGSAARATRPTCARGAIARRAGGRRPGGRAAGARRGAGRPELGGAPPRGTLLKEMEPAKRTSSRRSGPRRATLAGIRRTESPAVRSPRVLAAGVHRDRQGERSSSSSPCSTRR